VPSLFLFGLLLRLATRAWKSLKGWKRQGDAATGGVARSPFLQVANLAEDSSGLAK